MHVCSTCVLCSAHVVHVMCTCACTALCAALCVRLCMHPYDHQGHALIVRLRAVQRHYAHTLGHDMYMYVCMCALMCTCMCACTCPRQALVRPMHETRTRTHVCPMHSTCTYASRAYARHMHVCMYASMCVSTCMCPMYVPLCAALCTRTCTALCVRLCTHPYDHTRHALIVRLRAVQRHYAHT